VFSFDIRFVRKYVIGKRKHFWNYKVYIFLIRINSGVELAMSVCLLHQLTLLIPQPAIFRHPIAISYYVSAWRDGWLEKQKTARLATGKLVPLSSRTCMDCLSPIAYCRSSWAMCAWPPGPSTHYPLPNIEYPPYHPRTPLKAFGKIAWQISFVCRRQLTFFMPLSYMTTQSGKDGDAAWFSGRGCIPSGWAKYWFL